MRFTGQWISTLIDKHSLNLKVCNINNFDHLEILLKKRKSYALIKTLRIKVIT